MRFVHADCVSDYLALGEPTTVDPRYQRGAGTSIIGVCASQIMLVRGAAYAQFGVTEFSGEWPYSKRRWFEI
ncbi:MAG: hypothetical protein AAFN44_15605 [Pseudomonadota bacterium]